MHVNRPFPLFRFFCRSSCTRSRNSSREIQTHGASCFPEAQRLFLNRIWFTMTPIRWSSTDRGDASQHREREIARLGKSDTSFGAAKNVCISLLPKGNVDCPTKICVIKPKSSKFFFATTHDRLSPWMRRHLCSFWKIDMPRYFFSLQRIIVTAITMKSNNWDVAENFTNDLLKGYS